MNDETEGISYDFEELAFHFIFPSFRFEFLSDPEDLLNSSGYHPR